MNIRMKPDALWPTYKTIERETSMSDKKRRIEDQLPEQRLDWSRDGEPSSDEIRIERQQALLNYAAALLKAERAACAAVVFPESNPQQYVMVGSADDILRLLPLPGATDGHLRSTIRDITTLIIASENVDHLFNDPDLVRLLSALTALAMRRARGASPAAASTESVLTLQKQLRSIPCDVPEDLKEGLQTAIYKHGHRDALSSAAALIASWEAKQAASPAAAPAAGQAVLAKLERWAPHPDKAGSMLLSEGGNFLRRIDVEALFAPVAATEQATDEQLDIDRFWNKAIEAEAEAGRLRLENEALRAALRNIVESPTRCYAIASAALSDN